MKLVFPQSSNRLMASVEAVPVILDLDAIAASSRGEDAVSFTLLGAQPVQHDVFAGPASFFKQIAGRIAQPYCILLPKDGRIESAVLKSIVQSMQACGAVMGVARIQDADGTCSILPRRLEDLRFSSLVPLGAVVFTRDFLIRIAHLLPSGPWDDWWHFDLIRIGAFHGLVHLADEIVTKIKGPMPAFRHEATLTPLLRTPGGAPPSSEPILLVYGSIEASVSLYFDGLPSDIQKNIRFYSPRDPISDLPHLAMADGVIIVRDFEHMATSGLLELLNAMEVPLFWFTDDDLEALQPEYDAFNYYNSAAMKSFLATVCGVLVSTPPLMEIYKKRHNHVLLWPLVFDESLAASLASKKAVSPFRVGAFGGGFRLDSFLQDIMPALQSFRTSSPLEIYLRADLARGIEDPTMNTMPFDSSYRQFIFRWQQLRLDTVVHPFGNTRNIVNKSFGSILTSRYLGAVPIVAAECSQKKLSDKQGVLVAQKDPAFWRDSLQRLQDPEEHRHLFSALDSWCRSEFAPEKCRASYPHLLALLPAKPVDVERRLARALSHPHARDILYPEPIRPLLKKSFWEKLLRKT